MRMCLTQAGANVQCVDMCMHHMDMCMRLTQAGAKVQCVDRDRRTPLHWASEKSAEKSLRLLLGAGAEVPLHSFD